MKQIKKQIAQGLRDPDEDDPFELFISSTDIRYTYYKETDKILGNTYGICVLQVSQNCSIFREIYQLRFLIRISKLSRLIFLRVQLKR